MARHKRGKLTNSESRDRMLAEIMEAEAKRMELVAWPLGDDGEDEYGEEETIFDDEIR